ncbi:MAG: iron-containing alcohol dehydrogenase, partial [Deltaproteobacteria bacterium]|nr:iron-containing alcohol dehydrogenase [Deltaproteobacteria bacterium]
IEGISAMEAAGRAVSAAKKLCSDIRVPQLRDLDISEKEYFRLIPQMAKDGMESRTPLVNPRKPTEEDMMELFKNAY